MERNATVLEVGRPPGHGLEPRSLQARAGEEEERAGPKGGEDEEGNEEAFHGRGGSFAMDGLSLSKGRGAGGERRVPGGLFPMLIPDPRSRREPPHPSKGASKAASRSMKWPARSRLEAR
jgi:hypothetical protein